MCSEWSNYIVITTGSAGDIYPFIRIALSVQALGRNVLFISNSVHAKLVHDSGLDFLGFGTEAEYLKIIENPDIWHPQRAISVLFADSKERIIEIDSVIRSAVLHNPTVILAHPLVIASAAMVRDHGLPCKIVSVILAPFGLRTCYDPLHIGEITIPKWVPMSWRKMFWRFVDKTLIDPSALVQTNLARKAVGLNTIKTSYVEHIEEAPDLTVTLFPNWFCNTMPDWPRPIINADFQLFESVSNEGFSLELQEFIAKGEKPLVFTPGTANLHASTFFSCALAAVRKLGERAIFLTKDRSQLPSELPDSVLWQPYVPLVNLLPNVKVLVHHGGIGTTAEAFRAAIPQLVTPFAWDQFDNAARIEALGAGVALRASRITSGRFENAIRTLITSKKILLRCNEISRRVNRRFDPVELCKELEAVLLLNESA
jgi:rhamnosyltransferase subunit B